MTVIPAQEVEAEVPQGPQGRVSLPGIHEISALVNKPNKKFTWKGLWLCLGLFFHVPDVSCMSGLL